MLLVLTLSSGFAQFAMHMCNDSGVQIATESCSETDQCCSDEGKEGNDHCSTQYVYVLTAKFKDAIKKVDLRNSSFEIFLPYLNKELKLASYPNQDMASLHKYKRRQSPTDLSFSGVFII